MNIIKYKKLLKNNYKISSIEEASMHLFEKPPNQLNAHETIRLYKYMNKHPELY